MIDSDAIRKRCDAATELIDEMHTERLAYPEYLMLRDCVDDIPALLKDVERLRAEVQAAKDAARAAQDANSEAGNTITQLLAEKGEVQDEIKRLEHERNTLYDCATCCHSYDPEEIPCNHCGVGKEVSEIINRIWERALSAPPEV